MIENRIYEIFLEVIKTFDEGYDLSFEYDAIPHSLCGETLYQVEAHMIQAIGKNEGITITQLAYMTKKTPSACSQIVKKLIKKGLVIQNRNQKNRREYLLVLTSHGLKIYHAHESFDENCFRDNFLHIREYLTEEELKTYIKVQTVMNEAFRKNISIIKDEK